MIIHLFLKKISIVVCSHFTIMSSLLLCYLWDTTQIKRKTSWLGLQTILQWKVKSNQLTLGCLGVQMGAFYAHDPWPSPQACLDSRATETQNAAQATDPKEVQFMYVFWDKQGQGGRASLQQKQNRYSLRSQAGVKTALMSSRDVG